MGRRRFAVATAQLPLPGVARDSRSYAVFDLETTGLHVHSCQIIEIGWLVVRDAAVGEPRSVLVCCAGGVPAEIETLTGITTAALERNGVPLSGALDAFFADTAGLPLVGHNVLRFDLYFLEAACRVTGREPPERARYRDTAALYKAHRLSMRPRPDQDHWSFANEALNRPAPGVRYKLPVCCDALGIPRDGLGLHRAAADVLLTQRLYARLAGLGTDRDR